jgi:CheY-like chemotaxis protein
MHKVMVVDDDSTMVSLLKTLLELDGFEVAASNRELDIIENIREEQPDVVLMDVYLTNEDGIELLTKIRSSADLEDLVVVMTSGMNVSEQCLLAGAHAFLLKPYNPNQLIKVIQDHLDPE